MKNYIETFFIDNTPRPLLLILPGGGYEYTSKREALPIVKEFTSLEFHQGILYYREEKKHYLELIDNVVSLINELKSNALVTNIHIMGFSAGGHLAGYLLTKYCDLFKSGVLCYPVTSTKTDIMHEKSFMNLLPNYPIDLEKVSLENNVTSQTPPIYLWHTKADQSVNYLNSVVLYDALQDNNIKTKLTLFPDGPHGLSLVFKEEVGDMYSDVKQWVLEAKKWLLDNN